MQITRAYPSLALCILLSLPNSGFSRTTQDWITYEGIGEEFTLVLPGKPRLYERQRMVKVQRRPEFEPSRTYGVYNDGVVYLIASLFNPHDHESPEWLQNELLRRNLPQFTPTPGEAVQLGRVTGQEFSIARNDVRGIARVFITKDHAYLFAAIGDDVSNEAVKRFVDSIALNSNSEPHVAKKKKEDRDSRDAPLPVFVRRPAPLPSDRQYQLQMESTPSPGPVDYTRVFGSTEVTRKAVIILKPDPGYTEEGRRERIAGFVRLRCILSADGEVTNIEVLNGLPAGLSDKATDAAERMLFLPAIKDGRRVSQAVMLEYNFNIY